VYFFFFFIFLTWSHSNTAINEPVPVLKSTCTAAHHAFEEDRHKHQSPTKRELPMNSSERLERVSFCPNLVTQLIPSAEKLAFKIRPEDASWAAFVDPASSSSPLSKVINSEQDSRDWAIRCHVLPSMSALRTVKAKGPTCSQDQVSPYFVSAPGVPHIPDGLTRIGMPTDLSGTNTKHTAEFKTHNAVSDYTRRRRPSACNEILAPAVGRER
jgi:hypothetical protein